MNDKNNFEEIQEFTDEMDLENMRGNQNTDHSKEVNEEEEEMQTNEGNIHESENSTRMFSETRTRLEKLSVAPGEKGKFQNWGEDIFLEEKCFPELFPFGIGGYLSKIANDDEAGRKMGFAAYVKHRIMSADPKYRNNSAYCFLFALGKRAHSAKKV